MIEETKIQGALEEIKNADGETLQATIEKWFESTRMDGAKMGATYVSAAIYRAIEKNLKKGSQSSLRDYQRAIKRIMEIVSVQLTQQNDLKENDNISEDGNNDQ